MVDLTVDSTAKRRMAAARTAGSPRAVPERRTSSWSRCSGWPSPGPRSSSPDRGMRSRRARCD